MKLGDFMPKLIELIKDDNILVSSNIIEFIKPDKVYFELKEDAKMSIDVGDTVKIGTPLLKTKNNLFTSSISGKIGYIETLNNKEFITVINDFAESSLMEPVIKKNHHIKKDILDKILKSQFNLDLNHKKYLILNAIDDEPYVLTESFYLFLYYEGYLELLDLLAKIYQFDIIVCIKSSSSENINKLMECLGMYPNIKLNIVPNLYLLGNASILKDYLKLPLDTEVIKASFFYHIYNLIERNRLMSDKLITISGDGIFNPSIIRVKIGTRLRDVVKEVIDLKQVDLTYIIGGLMQGTVVNSIDDIIITNDFNSLLIMLKKSEKKSSKCLNCGA